MNWFKENPFISGLLAVVILAGGALGYFIAGAASRFSEASQSFDAQAAEFSRLSSQALHPNKDNVARLEEQTEEFRLKVDSLKSALTAMNPPDNPISPADFQAKLRERVDDFTAKAKAAGVALPEDFYLGFDDYRSGPPSSDAVAAALDRQLTVIEQTASLFLAQRVAEIRSVSREKLPEERGSNPAGPGPGPGPRAGQGPPGRPPAEQPPLVLKSPFEISVMGDQDRIRRALNEIPRLPFFVTIRSLKVRNTNDQPPKRADSPAATPAPRPENLFGGQGLSQEPAPAPRLEFIVGTERVELTAKLEYTLFP